MEQANSTKSIAGYLLALAFGYYNFFYQFWPNSSLVNAYTNWGKAIFLCFPVVAMVASLLLLITSINKDRKVRIYLLAIIVALTLIVIYAGGNYSLRSWFYYYPESF